VASTKVPDVYTYSRMGPGGGPKTQRFLKGTFVQQRGASP
jgi:hypothetical protein